jgi:hypothetical protein
MAGRRRARVDRDPPGIRKVFLGEKETKGLVLEFKEPWKIVVPGRREKQERDFVG